VWKGEKRERLGKKLPILVETKKKKPSRDRATRRAYKTTTRITGVATIPQESNGKKQKGRKKRVKGSDLRDIS